MSRTVYSYCHYCMCLCGTKIEVHGNKVQSIEPDRDNPHGWRDFCRKGMLAAQALEHPRRIHTPMRRVDGRYVSATYEEATEDIAKRLNRIIEEHGANAVASYSGNPLGFSFGNTMFWNGLLDAIGTGNRFWVGSVDQNNVHVVSDAMFGSELLWTIPDIDESLCFLLVGMDPSQSKFVWTESISDGWSRVLEAQRKGADLIIVDPRRSVSAERANLHVAVIPGQDWAFLLAVLHVIFFERLESPAVAVPLNGVEHIRALALDASLIDLADRCGIATDVITDVARRFAGAKRAVCVTHTGIAHTATGTLAEWLGTVINAVTNRFDQPGGRYIQPGYVDLIALGESYSPPSKHRTRLRDLPTVAGFHSLTELADEISTPGEGKIRAMIITAGNPVIAGPDGNAMDKAFSDLELLVSVDPVQRESHRHAHWLIPGTHFLEREGLHLFFGSLTERPFAQYARQAVRPPDGVKEEWEFFTDLALAMNRNLFGKPRMNAIIRATRLIARLFHKPRWAFGPHTVERALVKGAKSLKYDDILKHEHGWMYGKKEYHHISRRLRTPDKKIHCAPPKFLFALRQELSAGRRARDGAFPMLLVNRRTRESMNSWLNETPGLLMQNRTNALELHPEDAKNLNLENGQWARVSSAISSIDLPVEIVPGNRQGIVTIPHGWGSRIFDPRGGASALSLGANRNSLTGRNEFDPFSQIPVLNGVSVRVEKIAEPPASYAVDSYQGSDLEMRASHHIMPTTTQEEVV